MPIHLGSAPRSPEIDFGPVLTYRQKRALQAFKAFAREVPLERAIVAARRSVWTLPETEWDDPELQGLMADYLVELRAAGKLPGHTL